jgi:hypothetical protein
MESRCGGEWERVEKLGVWGVGEGNAGAQSVWITRYLTYNAKPVGLCRLERKVKARRE